MKKKKKKKKKKYKKKTLNLVKGSRILKPARIPEELDKEIRSLQKKIKEITGFKISYLESARVFAKCGKYGRRYARLKNGGIVF